MQEIKHTFILPLPPSLNATYGATYASRLKRTLMYKTAVAKKWERKAQKLLKVQFKGKLSKDPAGVNLTWYLKFRRDIDGGEKLILDQLEGIVLGNDRQINEMHIYRKWDKKNPRVVLEVFNTSPDEIIAS